MAKNSMRFDRFINIQENKPKKIGIETKENWINVGKTRKCSFKLDNGSEYNTNFADKVLLTATVKMNYDPNITEKMRVELIGKITKEYFKILAVMPVIENGRKITKIKVQRWAAL